MSAELESRGWEIENNYHEHWLDDPDYDLAEDEAEGGYGSFVAAIVLVVVLSVGTYALARWTTPPTVRFTLAPPMPQPVMTQDPNFKADPVHACGKLPACPQGRLCQIDNHCNIVIR